MGLDQQSSLLLSEFIKRNYSQKIVEVACGKHSYIALILSQSLQVVATDVRDCKDIDERIRPLYAKDDIESPDLKLYQNAQLLYSIRPPIEIQHSILKMARVVHADILIKPLGCEVIEVLQNYLRNYRGIAFHYVRADSALCC